MMISLCIAIIIGMHENGHESLIVYMYMMNIISLMGGCFLFCIIYYYRLLHLHEGSNHESHTCSRFITSSLHISCRNIMIINFDTNSSNRSASI